MKYFNTAGPIDPAKHYALDPLLRLDLEEVLTLIEQEKYFVLHAPRQTGKTSTLLALMKYLNERDQYRCLYINVEGAQAARENVKRAMTAILRELISNASATLDDPFLNQTPDQIIAASGEDMALNHALTLWCHANPKPVILLIDEIDSLVGDSLVSVLRQLRAGYTKRPALFPQTVVLCGVRDVRDYRIHSDQTKAIITGGSAFNIKAASLRLGNFSRTDIELLYRQHTEATGQRFSVDAVQSVWELTRGQPWLVNALGYETTYKLKPYRDRTRNIDTDAVEEAKERLIGRRETHLDQLADKLREPRVRAVIEPILAGDADPTRLPLDDVEYVRDLGLITTEGELRIANPIYREVIPRHLTYTTQLTIHQDPAWYILPDGRLDMEKLLGAFQQFFREHSEHWIERFDYKEAGPQLLMQAFLQRIVNGGGRIEREYGLGRLRTDLFLVWPWKQGIQRIVIELKLLRKGLESTLRAGLDQTRAYMDRCGADEGHLIIFDRDPDKPWEDKLFRRIEPFEGKQIRVWGM